MTRATCILILSLLASLVTPLAAANHDQDGIRFDSLGGNEWWVEVKLAGAKADWWGPEVRDTDGEWRHMSRPSWSNDPNHYVASFHIEPGHKVQFRMQEPKSSHYVLSCWFTHPAGVEACDGSETFHATFTPIGGDTERIAVRVDANDGHTSVYAMVAPHWYPIEMAKQEDGTWARHLHVPEGVVVRFLTWSENSGEEAESACYRWPSATPVACPDPYAAYAYSPHPVNGDWSHLEAWVLDDDEGAKVEVSFNGGMWQPMVHDTTAGVATYRGAPTTGENVVAFRLTSPAGEISCVDEAYKWPYPGSYAPWVGGHDDAVFAWTVGNQTWLQTNVYSPTPIVAVEAQVNNGPWTVMQRQPGCHWGKAMSAPEGSVVRFRAVFDDLSIDQSDSIVWPPGTENVPFDATVRPSGGQNAIRLAVNATRPVTEVNYIVNGGWGGNLVKQPDGTWLRSGYVPANVVLEFVVVGPEDADRKWFGCWRWPAVTPVDCEAGYDADMVYVLEGDTPSTVIAGAMSFDDAPLSKVQVRFDGGDFKDMTYVRNSQPGEYQYQGAPTSGDHLAEFRLVGTDGSVACDEDGYFWPQTSEFDQTVRELRITEFKGNENWVQANVYGWSVVAVEAQVNGGPWQALTLQPHCDWAKAMSAPAGSTVVFRAFDATLASVMSAPMKWPPGTTGGGFDATFTNVKGNEWWIQANVAATGGTLAKVEVSLNGGAWKPLTNRGWAWASSYHAPSGTIVQLRATSTTGATDLSGCYRWTTAAPVTCPGSGGGGGGGGNPGNQTFDATFKNVRGNEWWLEAEVTATGGTLAGVDARVNGGAWVALTKQSWGSWAKSVHAPAGSTVEFRARATDGSTEVSASYRWPPA